MKILYLAPGSRAPDQLAAFSFLSEEILGLADRGHTVITLSTVPNPGNSWPEGVQVCAFPASSYARRIRAISLAVRHGAPWRGTWRGSTRGRLYGARVEAFAADVAVAKDVDVIHSHFGWPAGWGGTLAAAVSKKPLVASLRGMDLLVQPEIGYGLRIDPGYDAAVRILLRRADLTTYASKFMQKAGVQLGADPSRAKVIYKGVDLQHFIPAVDRVGLKARLGVTGAMILTVAGLQGRKGIDDILRALPLLPDHLEFTFVVCGEGREEDSLKGLAKELGIHNRVRFMGLVSRHEIPMHFAACDVFVLASLVEAAGNVVLEAMAAGRPVVCTDSGGPPEYVRHAETGFVVPPRNPGALAEKIGRLLDHPVEAERMGASARTLAETEYPYRRLLDGFEAAYQEATLLRAHRGTRHDPSRIG